MQSIITGELLSNAYFYEEYKDLVMNLISENKTTGKNQSEKNVYFTRLNMERFKRIEKTTVIIDELKFQVQKINAQMIFLVIAEAWCGDVPQNVPVIFKISELNSNISFKIILRDENLPVMDLFLTNGGRAIPICAILKEESLEVFAQWGPRPAPAQEMMMDYKKTKSVPYDEVNKNIQLWYAQDKTRTLQMEFVEIFRNTLEARR